MSKRKECPGCLLGFTKGGKLAQVLFGDGSMREAEVCASCGAKSLTIVPVGSGMQAKAILAPYAKHLRKLAMAYPGTDRAEGLLQAAGILESGRAITLDDVRPAATSKPIELKSVPKKERPMPSVLGDAPTVQKSDAKMLAALVQRNRPTSRAQLAILSGYSGNSGGFNAALARLRANGWMTGDASRLEVTTSGRAAAPHVAALPTGQELLEFWCDKVGACAATILNVFVDSYPDEVPRAELAERTGYSGNSGGFNAALAVLRTLDLATGYRASKELIELMGTR
jgi:hypothetical protein